MSFKYNVEYLRDNLGNYIVPEDSKDGIAIDIGANNGCFIEKYSNFFSEIHAYEPNTFLFNLLKNKYQSYPHIFLYNEAIYHTSNKEVSLTKYNHNDEDGSFAIYTDCSEQHWSSANEICKTNTVCLDSVVSRCSNKNISYLKMDCETGEYYGILNKDLTPFKYIGIELHFQMGISRYTELYNFIAKSHNCNLPCNFSVNVNQELLFTKK